jgi:hypothetical protein
MSAHNTTLSIHNLIQNICKHSESKQGINPNFANINTHNFTEGRVTNLLNHYLSGRSVPSLSRWESTAFRFTAHQNELGHHYNILLHVPGYVFYT